MAKLSEQKLSQQEIANRMGVPQPAVCRWLQGGVIPRRRNLVKLAAVLGLNPDDLLVELSRRNALRGGDPEEALKP